MGNREDLLAGARKAIIERGVAKTTARDIAAAAGVSLAAIGYHFGSKERLITEALAESLGTGIGDAMESLIRDSTGQSMLEAFARLWNAMPQVFAYNREGMLASMENLVRVSRTPESQAFMAESLPGVYRDLGTVLRETRPDLTEDQAEAIAQLYFVLSQGLGVLWLISPGGDLPGGDRLAEAVTALVGGGSTTAAAR